MRRFSAVMVLSIAACRTIPVAPAMVVPAAIGSPAPPASGPTLNAALYGSARYSSANDLAAERVVVIAFGASYCQPCWLELPHLQKLAKKYAGRVQFVLVLIDEDADGIAMAAEAVNDHLHVTFPVVDDRRQIIADRYGVAELPTLWVADADGKLVWTERGFKGGSVEALDGVLRGLVGSGTGRTGT